MDQRDREHAARLAARNAAQLRPPLFCRACDARLRHAAVLCHYCGSEDLAVSQVSCPFFSEVAVNGACTRCHGTSFRTPGSAGVLAAGGLLVACQGRDWRSRRRRDRRRRIIGPRSVRDLRDAVPPGLTGTAAEPGSALPAHVQ
jgi:hypothetical protein